MALFKYIYKNLEDRQVKVKKAEALGQVMLHDNFSSKWKPGNEPFGTLIFTDTPPSPRIPELSRDLVAEVDDLKARVEALEKK